MLSASAVEACVKRLEERERRLGIEASVTQHFCGLSQKAAVSLKTLCSDFVVREIVANYNEGKPLVLESLSISSNGGVGDKRARDANDSGDQFDRGEIEAQFSSVLDSEDVSKLIAGLENGDDKIELKHLEDKQSRTRVHQLVRQLLGKTHISNADNGTMNVIKATAADRCAERRRSNPLRKRGFTHFTLYKENMDSNQAIRFISKYLGISTRQILFCGTKDKRAVTLQRMAIQDMSRERLAVLNARRYSPGTTLKVSGVATEQERGLSLGDAEGNHFEIVLRVHRNSSGSSASAYSANDLQAIERCLSERGSVNYFGPQRFGTTSVLTSDVGVALLKGDYEGAIIDILTSKASIVPDLAGAVGLLKQRAYAEALHATPHFCFSERDVLKHLTKFPNDFNGALRVLPRNMAMLYFHAVQSLVWNRMVSRRLRGDGCDRFRPEVGDLVLQSVYEQRLAGSTTATATPAATGGGDNCLPPVHRLTPEDPLEHFELTDVVIPLPGPDKDLVFPESAGCTRDDCAALLAEMGIADSLLDDTHALVKIFHFHGTYRNLCIRPRNVSIRKATAQSWRKPILLTDLQRLQQAQEQEQSSGGGGGEGTAAAATVAVKTGEEEEPVEVIVVSFSLGSGCYATSVLREFTNTVSENYHRVPHGASTASDKDEVDDIDEIPAEVESEQLADAEE